MTPEERRPFMMYKSALMGVTYSYVAKQAGMFPAWVATVIAINLTNLLFTSVTLYGLYMIATLPETANMARTTIAMTIA